MKSLLGLSMFINELLIVGKCDWTNGNCWCIFSFLLGIGLFFVWGSIVMDSVNE
jgi:hypothetical protein